MCTKFGAWTKFEVSHAAKQLHLTKNKIQDGGSRHFNFFCRKRNYSAAYWGIFAKFCRSVVSHYRKWATWPKSITEVHVTSRWRRPPYQIWFIAHNSVVIARICTKCGRRTNIDPACRHTIIFNKKKQKSRWPRPPFKENQLTAVNHRCWTYLHKVWHSV